MEVSIWAWDVPVLLMDKMDWLNPECVTMKYWCYNDWPHEQRIDFVMEVVAMNSRFVGLFS